MSGDGGGRLCKTCSCAAAPLRSAVGSTKVKASGDTNNRPESSSVREIVKLKLFGKYFMLTTNSRLYSRLLTIRISHSGKIDLTCTTKWNY